MAKLTAKQVESGLRNLPEWTSTGESIQRTIRFADFVAAMEFVKRIAAEAEREQHHPDILIRYDKVTLTLSTHDAGGMTAKDLRFAGLVDGLIAGQSGV